MKTIYPVIPITISIFIILFILSNKSIAQSCTSTISLILNNSEGGFYTNEPVELSSLINEMTYTSQSNEAGEVIFLVPCNMEYRIKIKNNVQVNTITSAELADGKITRTITPATIVQNIPDETSVTIAERIVSPMEKALLSLPDTTYIKNSVMAVPRYDQLDFFTERTLSLLDFEKKPLKNQSVIFVGERNKKVFKGKTNEMGTIKIYFPKGDRYTVKIKFTNLNKVPRYKYSERKEITYFDSLVPVYNDSLDSTRLFYSDSIFHVCSGAPGIPGSFNPLNPDRSDSVLLSSKVKYILKRFPIERIIRDSVRVFFPDEIEYSIVIPFSGDYPDYFHEDFFDVQIRPKQRAGSFSDGMIGGGGPYSSVSSGSFYDNNSGGSNPSYPQGTSFHVDPPPPPKPVRPCIGMVDSILTRNNWEDKLIVFDMSASMIPYNEQLVYWYKGYNKEEENLQFVFFNDGDGKIDQQKQIGSTGGLYYHASTDLKSLVDLMEVVRSNGSGGDLGENNLEALIYAVNIADTFKALIMVADRTSPIKDMKLIKKFDQPVHIILCGPKGFIHPTYLHLAWKTKGSLHVRDEDITSFSTVTEGQTITIDGLSYRFTCGQFIRINRTE